MHVKFWESFEKGVWAKRGHVWAIQYSNVKPHGTGEKVNTPFGCRYWSTRLGIRIRFLEFYCLVAYGIEIYNQISILWNLTITRNSSPKTKHHSSLLSVIGLHNSKLQLSDNKQYNWNHNSFRYHGWFAIEPNSITHPPFLQYRHPTGALREN